MKIYTKKGDAGKTSLFGGGIYSKDYIRIEAYGTIDELNANLGYLRDQLLNEHDSNLILRIQNLLFNIGANLATKPGKSPPFPALDPGFTLELESEIDRMDLELAPLQNFILPGGHPVVSWCHVCRTMCRRAERRLVTLATQESVDSGAIIYLNRLSDYLFVLGRNIARQKGVKEVTWQGLEKKQ
ncbi:MAG: cob(I)yrinic acid a,c-diamide adenosyltransferase [Saprospiraceae bacterium]|nr:cob(I)yrinic acid a,c-diamide adenosyltransferase [Saprospiraceae bacterium]